MLMKMARKWLNCQNTISIYLPFAVIKKCFLLVIAPDYNSEFRIESGLKTNPSVIRYSDLYDFFKKRLSEELAVGGVWENKYRLFLNTLKKHSISLEDEMLIRFKNAIKN